MIRKSGDHEPYGGRDLKEMAQDAIINAILGTALRYEEGGYTGIADQVRKEGTRIAKRFGLSEVSGLPGTWPKSQ